MPMKSALLLGVVFSKEQNPSRGQGFRDRVRCEALESEGEGYIVHTLDNKHDLNLAKAGCHCCANFTDVRKMFKSIALVWGPDQQYDFIALDYFFSPAGWVNDRWSPKFFEHTLPAFVSKGLIKENGTVWLPHVQHVTDMLETYIDELAPFYTWRIETDASANPLYSATERATDQLLLCPDNLTNATQVRPLKEGGPFYALRPLKEGDERMQRSNTPQSTSKRKEGEVLSPQGTRSAKKLKNSKR